MKKHSALSAQESCELLAAVVVHHSGKISREGTQMLSLGYENDDSALKTQGLRLLMLGSGLMNFVPLIKAGIMSKDQLMEYLDKCGA